MSNIVFYILAAYFVVISIVAVAVTMTDKRIAKKNEPLAAKYGKTSKRLQRRVPERTLLLIAALGGSVAMLITMRKIRHKTSKSKFMVGIPVIIILQAAVIVGALLLFNR